MIYKYALGVPINAAAVVAIPQGGRVLSCGEQEGEIVFWADVNPDAPSEDRFFHLVWTGCEAPSTFRFVGTVQHSTGIVCHVFEEGRA